MKGVELTKSQVDKLLEMCKILFHEYTTIPNDKNPKFLTISWFTTQGYFVQLMNDEIKENILIHWFEFCMTHLTTKISKQLHAILGHPTSDEFGRIDTWYTVWSKLNGGSFGMKQHPVDYLYEQFKKLKQ